MSEEQKRMRKWYVVRGGQIFVKNAREPNFNYHERFEAAKKAAIDWVEDDLQTARDTLERLKKMTKAIGEK